MLVLILLAPVCAQAQDADLDGLNDKWEMAWLGTMDMDGDDDPDDDGLPNGAESEWGTNPLDPDTDDDGLGDALELNTKTNPSVADTDGDGLSDGEEDINADGIVGPNETSPLDPDTDGDTLDDKQEVGPDPENKRDTDTDGTPDARDWDSDADGIPDKQEAGDPFIWTIAVDTDLDGTPDYLDLDSDGDAIPDAVEHFDDANLDGQPDPDADSDGIPNRLDLDSDDDTLLDLTEGTDDDDEDGIPNYLDPHEEPIEPTEPSDPTPTEPGVGDPNNPIDPGPEVGIDDPTEPVDPGPTEDPKPGPGAGGPPPPPEGPVTSIDPPGSGTEPPIEPFDPIKIRPPWGSVEPEPPWWDLDPDGDGVSSGDELDIGTDPHNPDTDGDGIPDGVEIVNPSQPSDVDQDGIPDALDLDSDDDSAPDAWEAGDTPAEPRDTDQDGTPDFRDTDSDGDDLLDRAELTEHFTSPILADTDGGSVDDGIEVLEQGTDPLDPGDDIVVPPGPWDGAHFQGGVTCAAGSGPGRHGAPLPLLALLALAGLRMIRRRTVALAGIKTALLLTVALAPAARAQVDAQSLRLTAPGTGILGTHHADSLGFLGYTAGVSTQFQRDPLTIARDGEVLRSVVGDRVDVTTHGAMGVWHFVDIGFDMPVVAHSDGQAPDDSEVTGAAMGDLRVWTRVQGLDQRYDGVSLSGVITLGLPTGDRALWAGAGGLTLDADVVVGRRFGGLTLLGAVGYRSAPGQTVLDFEGGDQLTFSAAASFEREREGVAVHVRVFGATRARAPFARMEETNMEAIGGMTWLLGGLRLGGGIGAGLLPGAGTPTFRVYASVGWAAPIARPEPLIDEPPGVEDLTVEDLTVEDPLVDTDGDGLWDKDDRCPTDPEDKDDFQDADGCPDPDNDKDGIPDIKDECPNRPETKNGTDDEDGCPDESLVKLDIKRGRIEILNQAMVHFDWNVADVPEAYLEVLRQVAHVMKTNPQIQRLEVQGHTSWTGGERYNLELSRNRAGAVVGWLMHLGVRGSRLQPKGYGFSELKVRAKGPANNQINRRVEFVILDGPK